MTTDPSSDVLEQVRWLLDNADQDQRYVHLLPSTAETLLATIERLSAERMQLREALAEARDVLDGMNDDEINLELMPTLNAALSNTAENG